MKTKTIEVCLSPILFPHRLTKEDFIVVIVDILRATTAICSAFENGVKEIIPVAGTENAKKYKEKGYLVAAERDGKILDFADFGNSPFNFMKKEAIDKTIAYSTTNGTQAIEMVKEHEVYIGSFSNLEILTQWLIKQDRNIVILCAGWKNKFNLEDSVFAGALAKNLTDRHHFNIQCDSTLASMDLWDIARKDLLQYIDKCSHRQRLREYMLDDVVEYCFTPNTTKVIPKLDGIGITDISKNYSSNL